MAKYLGETALAELVSKMKNYADNAGIVEIENQALYIRQTNSGVYRWKHQANATLYYGIASEDTTKKYVFSNAGEDILIIRNSATEKGWLLINDYLEQCYYGRTYTSAGSFSYKMIDRYVLSYSQEPTSWDTTPTQNSTNPVTSGGVYSALSGKQDTLIFDTAPTSASTNPVTSGGVYTALGDKVDKVAGKGLSTDDFVSSSYYTKTQIDGMVSSVYKPAGSVAFASLPTLSASVLGNVYNVTDAFTTTSDFVEGSGKTYPAGTNVVVVDISATSTPSYKFDVLAGMVDLSGYVPTTRKVNNKALSSDITLSASDVGALASDTTYVSSVNGSSGAVTGIQTTANLVTSFNSTTSDSKYPSEKLVKTSLDAKQDTMTEITTEEVDALFT